MTYLIGAIALCVLSVYCFVKSHGLYVEEKGVVIKLISIAFAIVSVVSAAATYHAIEMFIAYLKGN